MFHVCTNASDKIDPRISSCLHRNQKPGGGGRTGDRCSEPGRRLVATTLTRLGAQWRAVRRGDNMLPASAAAARLLLGLALLPASSHQQDPVCDAT